MSFSDFTPDTTRVKCFNMIKLFFVLGDMVWELKLSDKLPFYSYIELKQISCGVTEDYRIFFLTFVCLFFVSLSGRY